MGEIAKVAQPMRGREQVGLTYDITKSYDWNYAHAPDTLPHVDVPACPGNWDFCGIPVSAPIGIAAGPLLNSRWLLYYAALGFDVLTYKTVRSVARASFGLPNLLPVRGRRMSGPDSDVVADDVRADYDSWAISFGMPSKDPDVWQEDVYAARRALRPGQVLVVSVVASPEQGWSLERIAGDFAQCARWARDSGAHVIEANLSCPNVCTAEATLYASAEASHAIAAAVRAAVPDLPVVLKVGVFDHREQAAAFVGAVRRAATAISTTNTLSTTVRTTQGGPLFDGARRGIGGRLIADRCLEELQMLRDVIRQTGADLRLIGVGGVSTAADVSERLAAGAHHVEVATAAMLNPSLAITVREGLQHDVRITN